MIEPRRLRKEEIWEEAENFRKLYVKPLDLIPVPIEEILEIDLRISVLPKYGLKASADIDGFISNDLKTIYIDAGMYSDSRYDRRIRFTYAHEIGHFVLHRAEIRECKFESETDWIKFRERLPEDYLSWFEWQAYEFAGRLLVPKNALLDKIDHLRPKIRQYLKIHDNEDILIDYISRALCGDFDVSAEVIQRRIKQENIHDVIFT